MRIRRLLIAAGIVALPLGLAAPAHAAEGEEGHGEEVLVEFNGETITMPHIGECEGQELFDLVAAEGEARVNAIEDCFSEKSPILPKWPEVIWGGIAWLLVILLVGKFALPQLKKTMQARSDKIRGDLEAAESAKQSANMELEQYRAQLADARNEANRIVEAARADAETVKRDLLAAAEAEAAQIRTRAQADIALAQDRALADLRTQVAAMSVDLAGKIVERNLDASAQQDLIESYIRSVGSN